MDDPVPRFRVVVLASDDLVLHGLQAVLAAVGVEIAGSAREPDAALTLLERHRPAVVVVDLGLDGIETFPGLAGLAVLTSASRTLALSRRDDEHTVATALATGVQGFLVHGSFDAGDLVRALHACAQGQSHLCPEAADAVARMARRQSRARTVSERVGLSPREAEAMRLVSQGLSNARIAHLMFLSEKTVKNHLTRAFAKLGTRNRAEAAAVFTGQAENPTDHPTDRMASVEPVA